MCDAHDADMKKASNLSGYVCRVSIAMAIFIKRPSGWLA